MLLSPKVKKMDCVTSGSGLELVNYVHLTMVHCPLGGFALAEKEPLVALLMVLS